MDSVKKYVMIVNHGFDFRDHLKSCLRDEAISLMKYAFKINDIGIGIQTHLSSEIDDNVPITYPLSYSTWAQYFHILTLNYAIGKAQLYMVLLVFAIMIFCYSFL